GRQGGPPCDQRRAHPAAEDGRKAVRQARARGVTLGASPRGRRGLVQRAVLSTRHAAEPTSDLAKLGIQRVTFEQTSHALLGGGLDGVFEHVLGETWRSLLRG